MMKTGFARCSLFQNLEEFLLLKIFFKTFAGSCPEYHFFSIAIYNYFIDHTGWKGKHLSRFWMDE
jgi:hypothetical protein